MNKYLEKVATASERYADHVWRAGAERFGSTPSIQPVSEHVYQGFKARKEGNFSGSASPAPDGLYKAYRAKMEASATKPSLLGRVISKLHK